MDSATALVEENHRLGELLCGVDPETPVPTCPGWVLRQLLTHVGRGDRWAATIVRERAEARVDIRTVPGGKPPAADPDDGPMLADGATLHLHATDDGLGAAGEWLVRCERGRVAWEHGHGKGIAAVRGSAADLLQAVLRRIPADDPSVQVLGDAGAWRT